MTSSSTGPSAYKRGRLLGEGTWGHVYEASHKDGHLVAIKIMDKAGSADTARQGINFTALREIKYLREFRSPYIVSLEDVFVSDQVLHLVLEHCPFDLRRVIYDKSVVLRTAAVKSYLRMTLLGIEHLHNHYIVHRDLAPANLLIGHDGIVKLADFGLARSHGSPNPMTAMVVTRWYRAPELLFGARFYGSAVDVWAIGCIFAELILRVALFQGQSDAEQAAKIFNVLGTPTPESWPGVELLPKFVAYEPREPLNLVSLFGGGQHRKSGVDESKLPSDLDLLIKMLALNPSARITASQALRHPYFSQSPIPLEPRDLPIPAGCTLLPIESVKTEGALDQETKRPRLD